MRANKNLNALPTAATLFIVLLSVGSPATVSGEEATAVATFHDVIHVVDEGRFVYPVDEADSVKISFGIGELDIDVEEASEIRAEVSIDCKELSEARCAKYRGRLRLEADTVDGIAEVRLTGLPRWKLRKIGVDGHITVPRWIPLEAHIGIGDVEIRSGERDLSVAMGIGDLTIRVPHDSVAAVAMATRIGDASLRGEVTREGKRRKLLGARIDWREGPGNSQIAVGLKIGDAKVVLE